ncbi:hypothetical protein AURDEDRAFT_175378 [Auricularia subglabra TFB-10046 SS5]|uniref:F-box domain-containing protein n=1 Tax=Auricularia subglabra (strain TFB-10046 / SS5) TaxID=717982 RepID=J0D8I9_AURST|nr:hypothetical protein AURDEDRAFT_175378 [Auricularia subglabra TFB-10046 SS5]
MTHNSLHGNTELLSNEVVATVLNYLPQRDVLQVCATSRSLRRIGVTHANYYACVKLWPPRHGRSTSECLHEFERRLKDLDGMAAPPRLHIVVPQDALNDSNVAVALQVLYLIEARLTRLVGLKLYLPRVADKKLVGMLKRAALHNLRALHIVLMQPAVPNATRLDFKELLDGELPQLRHLTISCHDDEFELPAGLPALRALETIHLRSNSSKRKWPRLWYLIFPTTCIPIMTLHISPAHADARIIIGPLFYKLCGPLAISFPNSCPSLWTFTVSTADGSIRRRLEWSDAIGKRDDIVRSICWQLQFIAERVSHIDIDYEDVDILIESPSVFSGLRSVHVHAWEATEESEILGPDEDFEDLLCGERSAFEEMVVSAICPDANNPPAFSFWCDSCGTADELSVGSSTPGPDAL